jgi:hypothetical protein
MRPSLNGPRRALKNTQQFDQYATKSPESLQSQRLRRDKRASTRGRFLGPVSQASVEFPDDTL